jgi:hypothetical protein
MSSTESADKSRAGDTAALYPETPRLYTSSGPPPALPHRPIMSIYARTPESYAAWLLVKLSGSIRPEEQIWAEYEERKEELNLFSHGTRCPFKTCTTIASSLILSALSIEQTFKSL